MDFVGACSEWASGLSSAAEQSSAWGQEPQGIKVWSRSMDVAFLQVALFLRRACSKWASGLSLAPEQSIGGRQEAWFGRLYKVDFVEACSEWASGLSLAAEQSIGWREAA